MIFGATGHLGAYTLDYLKEKFDDTKYELIAIGRKQTNFFKKQGIEYYQVDVTDKNTFKNLPRKNIYAVICFVGIMPAAMEGYNPYSYVDVNVTGILNVLEYCRINQ